MKLICLIMICALPLMMSGCLAGVNDVTEAKPTEEIFADQEQIIHELVSTWEITHHANELHEAVNQESVRWQHSQTAIPFVIADTNEGDQEHLGLFQANNQWEIKGKSSSGYMFKLENNEGIVTLSHGSNNQTYGQDNFQFLLPKQHIEVIQNILKERNYEYLSWSQAENGWYVEFRSSIQPFEHIFADYLQGHFTEKKEFEYQLNGFSVRYTLQLRTLEDKLVLKGIYFSLIKNEVLLDTLHFIL